MTNTEIMQSDMLDIIFEHRNKSYGAYALRRDYNSRLLIALMIAISIVIFFYLLSLFQSNNHSDNALLDNGDDKTIVKLTPIEIQETKVPPAQVKKHVETAQIQSTGIKIVSNLEKANVATQTEIETQVISAKTIDGPAANEAQLAIAATAGKSDGDNEKPAVESNFQPVEVSPSFPGGPEALALFFSRNLSSPSDLDAGERKIVLVRFVVSADGSISSAEITQSGGVIYDKEVLRAFKRMPKWNPASQNGNKIAVSFTQPVTFVGVDQ